MDLLATLQDLAILDQRQVKKLQETDRNTDTPALLRDLVHRGWLTEYQANEVNQGRAAELSLGSYVLLDRLGGGGMGEVFRARHRLIRTRVVALKVIRADRLDNPAL